MADLANLRISVDSRDVNSASQSLDNLSASAGRTNASVDKLTAANQRMAAAFATSNKPLIDATRYLVNMQNELERVGKSSLQIKALEIRMAAAAAPTAELAQEIRDVGAALLRAERNMGNASNGMGQVANRTKLASHEVTNLAFQFQDLGVQLAGGANPLVALAQQGSQVSGIMMQSGMSTRQFGSAVLSMIGNATKALLLNPIFLGIAGAVGAVSLALNFMGDDIKKATGQTVTAGDIMLGTFDVIRDGIKNQVTAAFQAMGLDTGKVWDDVVKYTRKAINIVIGIATLAPRTIIAAFKVLPAAIADIFYSSVNLAITAINSIVQKSVAAINSFIGAVNPILEKAGLKIGTLTAPTISALENNYAGAADRAAKAFVKVAIDTINTDFIGEFASVIGKAAAKRGAEREAEKAGKKVGHAAGKAAKDELTKMFSDALDDIRQQMGGFNPLMPMDSIDEVLAAQAKAQNEINAKKSAALQSDIDFATNAAEDIGNLIGGAFGQGVKNLAELINRDFPKLFGDLGSAFKNIAGAIDGVLSKLGTSLKSLGQGAAIGGIAASATGGSGLGGSIGGAIGQEFGAKVLGKALGSFAGPLGAIAGGLLGGIVGGLFKKTKEASATIASIGGQAVVSTINGNNAELKGAANNIAKGLLKGIADIAEQLGGTLGGAVKISIGQRNKDFVVDPTGAGRTKGAGVINFGQDQAAAVAYVTQLAIQQGIITGISAGAQTLIKAGGDLSDQVQKALKFDQVFKDLRKETDPLGASLDDLASEMMKLKAIFAEAGASAEDYAKLEELFAIKQAKVTFEANKPLRELEIQLMEAQGRAAAALAARRELELAAMDESQRALQQQIWAAEDAAKAAQEMAEASARSAEEAAALAANRARLEIALMDAQGNAAAALAARRQLELEGMDANLRGLQRQIWAAEDAAKANEELAAAQTKAAEEAKAAAEAAAQAASALAVERRNLEIELMDALGQSSEALAARRQLELNAMDASLRGLKEQIWAAQDKAIKDAAAAKAAEEAAAMQAKATEEAAQAAQRYQDALSSVTKTIQDEIDRLRGIEATTNPSALKAQFAILTAQARSGNLDALGKLPEVSKAIEQATIASAQSAIDVARIRAWLAASLGETISTQPVSSVSVATTGPGLVYDGNQASMSSSAAMTADGISVLRSELQNALYQIAKNTGKSSDIMNRWDGDGIPDFRNYASDTY